MGKKTRKPTTAPAEEPVASEGVELPKRWSVPRKTERVLRLRRGEPLEAGSRESPVPAHERDSGTRVFLETGARGLKTRTDPEERELDPGPGQDRRADDAVRAVRVPHRKKGTRGRVEEAAVLRRAVSPAPAGAIR